MTTKPTDKKPSAKVSPYVWRRHTFAGTRLPKNRVLRSFLLIVPWIDLLAVAFFLYLISRETVIHPGRVADISQLSQVQLEEGLLAKYPTAIIRPLITPDNQRKNVTILFLDDTPKALQNQGAQTNELLTRYTSDQPNELEALQFVHLEGKINLLIDDESIPHGEIIRWKERLRACGVTHINEIMPAPATTTP